MLITRRRTVLSALDSIEDIGDFKSVHSDLWTAGPHAHWMASVTMMTQPHIVVHSGTTTVVGETIEGCSTLDLFSMLEKEPEINRIKNINFLLLFCSSKFITFSI